MYVHVSTHTFEVHLNMVYNVIQVMVLTLVYSYDNMFVLTFICSITKEYIWVQWKVPSLKLGPIHESVIDTHMTVDP